MRINVRKNIDGEVIFPSSSAGRKGSQSTTMVIYILVLLTFLAAGGTSVSRTDHVHVMMFCFMVKRIIDGGVEVISFGLFHSTHSLPLATFLRAAGNSAFCSNFAIRSHSDGSIIWVDRQHSLPSSFASFITRCCAAAATFFSNKIRQEKSKGVHRFTTTASASLTISITIMKAVVVDVVANESNRRIVVLYAMHDRYESQQIFSYFLFFTLSFFF